MWVRGVKRTLDSLDYCQYNSNIEVNKIKTVVEKNRSIEKNDNAEKKDNKTTNFSVHSNTYLCVCVCVWRCCHTAGN